MVRELLFDLALTLVDSRAGPVPRVREALYRWMDEALIGAECRHGQRSSISRSSSVK
jgi:hypothetical protein